MRWNTTDRRRIAATGMMALALTAGATVPAHADIPPVGKLFKMKTTLKGRAVCLEVKPQQIGVDFYAASDCNGKSKSLLWKRLDYGGIRNAAVDQCIGFGKGGYDDHVGGGSCLWAGIERRAWHQRANGVLWMEGADRITRQFIIPTPRSDGDDEIMTIMRYNNTTPPGALAFTFTIV